MYENSESSFRRVAFVNLELIEADKPPRQLQLITGEEENYRPRDTCLFRSDNGLQVVLIHLTCHRQISKQNASSDCRTQLVIKYSR